VKRCGHKARVRLYRFSLYALLSTLYPLLLGCHSVPPPTPLDQLTPQQTRGYRYFQSHCAQCHYDRQPDPLHGPSLLSLYKKPYMPSGAPANDERVTAVILHGHNLMPASPETNPNDLQNLLAYLHTL
jgi:mono/diheme cytochrome c family protein